MSYELTPKSTTNSQWWSWPWQAYCAIYVLLVKLFAWGKPPSSSNRTNAAVAIFLVKAMYLVDLFIWYQIHIVRYIDASDGVLWMLGIVLASFDCWFFGRAGVSLAFEMQFDSYPLRKRILLGSVAIVFLAALLPFMFYSRDAYAVAFHLPQP